MTLPRRTTAEIVRYLGSYEEVVEVGIGHRFDVARALVERGVTVTATDVRDITVPEGVRFVEDDIINPDPGVYDGCAILYALNMPPELHRPTYQVARRVDAEFVFTTLGWEQPEVPVRRETVPGDTLYVCDDGPDD